MKCKIKNASGGQYYVQVVAGNGAILAHSENYTSKQSARNCADIIAGGGTVQDDT
jgi:uncharacterized protein YegP (UPF0339 family)